MRKLQCPFCNRNLHFRKQLGKNASQEIIYLFAFILTLNNETKMLCFSKKMSTLLYSLMSICASAYRFPEKLWETGASSSHNVLVSICSCRTKYCISSKLWKIWKLPFHQQIPCLIFLWHQFFITLTIRYNKSKNKAPFTENPIKYRVNSVKMTQFQCYVR